MIEPNPTITKKLRYKDGVELPLLKMKQATKFYVALLQYISLVGFQIYEEQSKS